MAGRNVLVTGAGGALGRCIAEKLMKRGDRVWSFSKERQPDLLAGEVTYIVGDVADGDAVERACRDKDLVFHLESMTDPWGRMAQYHKVNTKGTRNIIAGCRKQGVPVLVYTGSTRTVLGKSDFDGGDESRPYPKRFRSKYAMSMAFAEQAVMGAASDRLRTVVLKPHMVWGPGIPWPFYGSAWIRDKAFRIGDGTNRVTGVYIDNAADAHIHAAECVKNNPALSGRRYFLGYEESILVWDFIEQIRRWSGSAPSKYQVSLSSALKIGKTLETVHKIFKLGWAPWMTENDVRELGQTHVFNTGAMERDMGFVHDVTVMEGLEMYKAWLESIKEKV